MRFGTLVIFLSVALAVSGCGRKGGLEAPSAAEARPAEQPSTVLGTLPMKEKPPEPPKSKRPFILDALI